MKLLDALRHIAPVTQALDLSKLGEHYRDPETGDPILLPFRVDWTRAMFRRRFDLVKETRPIQQAVEKPEGLNERSEAELAEMNEHLIQLTHAWDQWWAEVLLLEPEEVAELRNALPAPHWEWITTQVVERALQYQEDETKKVLRGPWDSSAELKRTPRDSGGTS